MTEIPDDGGENAVVTRAKKDRQTDRPTIGRTDQSTDVLTDPLASQHIVWWNWSSTASFEGKRSDEEQSDYK